MVQLDRDSPHAATGVEHTVGDGWLMVSATATPHGLACFTITQAGLPKRCTSFHAASVS